MKTNKYFQLLVTVVLLFGYACNEPLDFSPSTEIDSKSSSNLTYDPNFPMGFAILDGIYTYSHGQTVNARLNVNYQKVLDEDRSSANSGNIVYELHLFQDGNFKKILSNANVQQIPPFDTSWEIPINEEPGNGYQLALFRTDISTGQSMYMWNNSLTQQFSIASPCTVFANFLRASFQSGDEALMHIWTYSATAVRTLTVKRYIDNVFLNQEIIDLTLPPNSAYPSLSKTYFSTLFLDESHVGTMRWEVTCDCGFVGAANSSDVIQVTSSGGSTPPPPLEGQH